jgi:hypothetical protein
MSVVGATASFRSSAAKDCFPTPEATPALVSNFSIQKAHADGEFGEFFTPPSLVQTIVNVIGPDRPTRLAPNRRPRERERKSAAELTRRSRTSSNCHI